MLFRYLCLIALLGVSACGSQNDTNLFIDAVDYAAFQPISGCPADPPSTVYHSCIDSQTLYEAAVTSANDRGTPLMVIWGFNECPYCKVFDGENFDPSKPWKTSAFIKKLTPDQRSAMSGDQLANYQISILRLNSRTQHGLDLADKLGVTDLARERGWHRVWSPFIMVVDPQTGAIHTEEQWNAQWSFCESASEFIVNLVAIGALPDDPDHIWEMCPSA